MLPTIDVTIPNTLNVKPGTYHGVYGGTQCTFPCIMPVPLGEEAGESVTYPLLQYQVTFDGPGVRGMYPVDVIVTADSITLRDASEPFFA